MPIFVNNVEITDQDVHQEMQYHAAPSLDQARHKAAQALIIRQLLLQAAEEKKLIRNIKNANIEKQEQAINALIKKEVTIPSANEENCKRYYQNNKNRFIDKKNHTLLPFENVSDLIKDYLHTRALQTAISQYIKILSRKAHIIGFNMEEESANPLVQ